MSPQLSPSERRALKARAHGLAPTVLIGNGGSDPGRGSGNRANLTAHELIKVRVPGGDRSMREDILQRICDELSASAVQHIGKILVLYRAQPDAVPKPKPKKIKRKEPRALKRNFQNRA